MYFMSCIWYDSHVSLLYKVHIQTCSYISQESHVHVLMYTNKQGKVKIPSIIDSTCTCITANYMYMYTSACTVYCTCTSIKNVQYTSMHILYVHVHVNVKGVTLQVWYAFSIVPIITLNIYMYMGTTNMKYFLNHTNMHEHVHVCVNLHVQ